MPGIFFDSLLSSLNGGGGGPDDFDIFNGLGGMPQQAPDTGAIFVPVEGAAGGSDFGTASPNGGLQQWVSDFCGDM